MVLCCFCRQEGRQAQVEAPQLQEEGRAQAPPLPQEALQEAGRGVEEYDGGGWLQVKRPSGSDQPLF